MSFDSRQYEFADIKVSILGKRLTTFRGLTTKVSQEKELVYGEGNRPISVQRGNKKFEGTLMCLKSDLDDMNAIARAAGYDSLLDVPGRLIDIDTVYEKELDIAFSSKSCINVEFTEIEDGMKQGDKFKEISLPFVYLREKNS
jgi:hypothetical protein